ncbi:MAG TPA: radical SAM protein [Polyangiaceae bacterium]
MSLLPTHLANRGRPLTHDMLTSYRGAWHLPWIIERYLVATQGAFTLHKVLNAAIALLEMQMGVVETRSLPIVLRLEPCNICNLKCPLCACGNGADTRKKGVISIDDFVFALEQCKENAMILRLDGLGEPTLHPRIFELVRIAKSLNYSVVMHSNLNTRACAEPEQFVDCGLDRLVISIDGATPETHAKYRVGGDLDAVVSRTRRLVQYRKLTRVTHPIVEVQTVDFDFNRPQREQLHRLCQELEVDRYEITEAESFAKREPSRLPHQCFWLWTVATVTWDLEYRSCANAWSLQWPLINMRDTPIRDWWNCQCIREARRFNLGKQGLSIGTDCNCKCGRCYEMAVVPLQGRYTCE